MAYIIGQYGIASLGSYGKLIACCYLAAVLFIVVLGGIVKVLAGVNLWKLIVYIKDELSWLWAPRPPRWCSRGSWSSD